MKFSVNVEIDSQKYESEPRAETPSRSHLVWDIKVVDVKSMETPPQCVSPTEDNSCPKRAKVGQEGEGMIRRVSRMEQEDMAIRQVMRKTSRKVSREGEWLVFREKTGLLTTQNGTQLVKETRVKLGTPEFAALIE